MSLFLRNFRYRCLATVSLLPFQDWRHKRELRPEEQALVAMVNRVLRST